VAHQYISQITQSSEGGKGKHEDSALKDAVFGNVGSMMCFKIGAQDAEVMEKEFAPVFSQKRSYQYCELPGIHKTKHQQCHESWV
jgi:hypothetical protein